MAEYVFSVIFTGPQSGSYSGICNTDYASMIKYTNSIKDSFGEQYKVLINFAEKDYMYSETNEDKRNIQ